MALPYLQTCFVFVFRTLQRLLLSFLSLRDSARGKHTLPSRVPPVLNPLLLLSATELARRIRKKQVTSVEVVQTYIDRIQQVNPIINAVIKDRFSAALQEAAQVDQLINEENVKECVLEQRFPLLGVPVTIKESFSLQGMPNSTGLLSRADVVSLSDAPVVTLLKSAGAVPLGVTNCSELCMWYECHNRLYGFTRNPYDTSRIAGGSSGGEGSILASGGSVIGLGSDVGGSIRMPAFFNGIYGHKPSRGVVCNEGQHPPTSGLQNDFLSTGPMCRYAEDLLLMLRVMAGPTADCLRLASPVDVRTLRFFSVPHNGGSALVSRVEQQLMQAQRKVVERLQADLGVEVEEMQIPELRYSFEIWAALMASPGEDGQPVRLFAEHMSEQGPKVWPVWELFRWMLGRSSHTLAAIGLALAEMFQSSRVSPFILEQKEKLQNRLEELLGSDGVLLYPSHPHVAPKHHEPLCMPFNFSYTAIFNILGLPVTQCPLGLGADGLPLGVQLVCARQQDRVCLSTALYLQQAFGGWIDPGSHL